jgi:hypothetical protein
MLSASGAARRAQILADAMGAADARRRRARVRRVATGIAVATTAGACLFAVLSKTHDVPAPAPQRSPIVIAPPHTAPSTAATFAIQIIRTEDVKPRWETIGDDQLLAMLAEAGRPSGMVELNGKAVVVPQ